MEDVGTKQQDCMSWYWFMVPTTIVIITMFGAPLIISDDIVSWLAVILLFGCIIIMVVAPANMKARATAKFFSLTLMTMLVTMFCAKLNEYFPLPVMCIACSMILYHFAAAWCDFFLR